MRYESEGWGHDGLRDRPIGGLLGDFVDEGRVLLREEVRLAKAELREEARKAAKGGAAMGAGGAVLYVALMLLGVTLILVGATFLPAWLSALIVTAIYAAAGWAALQWGKKELARVDPKRPVEHIQEDKRWASETMRDVKRTRRAHG